MKLLFHPTPCYWRTNSVTLGKKCEVMCHPVLQIAHKANLRPQHQSDKQGHMIRWNLPGLSDLRYSSEAILPNRPPMSRNHISSLATHPGRVSSSSLIVSRTATQPLISACALAQTCVTGAFLLVRPDGDWVLLFYLWPLQGLGKERFSQSHPLITPSPANHHASSLTFLQNEWGPSPLHFEP